MSEQRCICGHVYSIHRLNRQIGDRNECWALNDDQMQARYCQCRQFALGAQSPSRPEEVEP